jgi:hypothetical protein
MSYLITQLTKPNWNAIAVMIIQINKIQVLLIKLIKKEEVKKEGEFHLLTGHKGPERE